MYVLISKKNLRSTWPEYSATQGLSCYSISTNMKGELVLRNADGSTHETISTEDWDKLEVVRR